MTVQRRGKNVAAGGAVLQLIFTGGVLAIWLWTGSAAAMSCTWLLASGVGVWLMAALLLYCRQLQQQEAAELEEIASGGAAGTIFEGADEAEVRPAARRLARVERWVGPLFTLLWAAVHVAVGVLVLRALTSRAGAEFQAPGAARAMVFSVLIAFLAFLFSRYSTGMGRRLVLTLFLI